MGEFRPQIILMKSMTIDDKYVQEAGPRHPGEDGDDQHRRRLHPRHQALEWN